MKIKETEIMKQDCEDFSKVEQKDLIKLEVKRYIEKVRKTLIIQKGQNKKLTGAMYTGENVYERKKQIEMKKMLEEHERQVNKEYDEKVKKAAEEELREKAERQIKEREKTLQYKNDLEQQ